MFAFFSPCLIVMRRNLVIQFIVIFGHLLLLVHQVTNIILLFLMTTTNILDLLTLSKSEMIDTLSNFLA